MKAELQNLLLVLTPVNRLLLNSLNPEYGINRTEDSFAITSKENISGI